MEDYEKGRKPSGGVIAETEFPHGRTEVAARYWTQEAGLTAKGKRVAVGEGSGREGRRGFGHAAGRDVVRTEPGESGQQRGRSLGPRLAERVADQSGRDFQLGGFAVGIIIVGFGSLLTALTDEGHGLIDHQPGQQGRVADRKEGDGQKHPRQQAEPPKSAEQRWGERNFMKTTCP
jgi:hypothetical protein